MKGIPHYDLHVVQRDKNIADYLSRGARDVIKIQTAYEPTIHFPPPEGWSDEDRTRGVSFIGTPYDDRAQTLTRLSSEFPVVISGNERLWRRALTPEAFSALHREGELYQQHYREAIWRSKINLSFLTHSNQDEFVHKSFEIAGCGSFLLAERSEGHSSASVRTRRPSSSPPSMSWQPKSAATFLTSKPAPALPAPDKLALYATATTMIARLASSLNARNPSFTPFNTEGHKLAISTIRLLTPLLTLNRAPRGARPRAGLFSAPEFGMKRARAGQGLSLVNGGLCIKMEGGVRQSAILSGEGSLEDTPVQVSATFGTIR
jgi:hypothetical protein